ncbi:MAG: hypothetical protein ACRDHL_12655 [Candidatus Promineifilaceae bacterium]
MFQPPKAPRRALLSFAIGLLVGLGAGLFLGWVAWPIEVSEASPLALAASYQRDYTIMIAGAYAVEGDLAAAERRLASLAKPDTRAWLLSAAVDHILQGGDPAESRQLAELAAALGIESPALAPFLDAEPSRP